MRADHAGTAMRPDFVITGSKLPDGRVQVIASRALKNQELACDVEWMGADPWSGYIGKPYSEYTLTTRMSKVVLIQGPDYPTVMARLMGKWQEQDEQGRKGLPAQPAIEAGEPAPHEHTT
jgi:hypothetical protein